MEPVYGPVIALIKTGYALMGYDISVHGSEHIPTEGGALIATNHIGYLDFTFIGYGALRRKRLVRFMAKKEIFDHKLAGPLMRGMKHVPVDRFGRATDAIQAGVSILEEGEVLGMFPEATISRSFMPAPAKTGAARMATLAGVPIVPSAVWGSQRILTKGRPKNFQRGIAIDVRFGEPIVPNPDQDAGELTDQVMTRVFDLVDEASRAYPQSPRSEEDRWWQPAHLGGAAPSMEEARAMAEREAKERRERRRAERRRERERGEPGNSADTT